jgi:uncharacterized membrane protein YdbT with pleckstrin-like domain
MRKFIHLIDAMSKTQKGYMDRRSHQAMFRNNPVLFVGAGLLIPIFGVGIIVLFVWWIKTLTDTLILTEHKIIKREGLLSKYTVEISYRDIESISIKQSFWDRIFDVGTIGIASSSQNPQVMVFHGYRHPEGIKATLEKEALKQQTAAH